MTFRCFPALGAAPGQKALWLGLLSSLLLTRLLHLCNTQHLQLFAFACRWLFRTECHLYQLTKPVGSVGNIHYWVKWARKNSLWIWGLSGCVVLYLFCCYCHPLWLLLQWEWKTPIRYLGGLSGHCWYWLCDWKAVLILAVLFVVKGLKWLEALVPAWLFFDLHFPFHAVCLLFLSFPLPVTLHFSSSHLQLFLSSSNTW
jgi:hypothetical protein